MSATCLAYKGTVNITLQKSKYKFKNNGTADLFTLIARFLAGSDVFTTELPSRLDLREAPNNTILSNKINISSKTVVGNKLRVAATLLGSNLTSFTAGKTYTLYLLSGSDKQLASIQLDAEILNQLYSQQGEGRQALIEWDLEFTNTAQGGDN